MASTFNYSWITVRFIRGPATHGLGPPEGSVAEKGRYKARSKPRLT